MKILVLDDGIPGNTVQSLGIAEALNLEYSLLPVKLKGLSYRIPGRKGSVKIISKLLGLLLSLKLYNFSYIILKCSSANPMPEKGFDAVISAGSYLAPINLAISKKFRTKSICIMTPENISLKEFDLLIVPLHDMTRYPKLKKLKNVFVTICAPNRVNEEKLRIGKQEISNHISIPDSNLKIGIILGGNDQNYFMDRRWVEKLFQVLRFSAPKKNLSYLLTTSRRTPQDVVDFLIEKTSEPVFVYREFAGISRISNYFGILGICDILLVTEDSVTMISEACSTGKPVIVLGSGRRKKRLVFDATIERLVKNKNCLYVPSEKFSELPAVITESLGHDFSILEDTKKCASKISEMLNTRKS